MSDDPTIRASDRPSLTVMLDHIVVWVPPTSMDDYEDDEVTWKEPFGDHYFHSIKEAAEFLQKSIDDITFKGWWL